MANPPLFLYDRLYIPKGYITPKLLRSIKKEFEVRFFDEGSCTRCELLTQRPSTECMRCPANLGHYKLWNIQNSPAGRSWLRLSLGGIDTRIGRYLLAKYPSKDRRATPPLKHKWALNVTFRSYQLNVTFRSYQQAAIKEVLRRLETEDGVLVSPPRTGKTLMGLAILLTLGHKTLILGSQYDYLYEFIQSIETKTQGKSTWYGLCNTLEDFKKYDICLATYQTFLSDKGRKLLHQIRSLFGTILVDEVHKSGADKFSEIMLTFTSRYKLGLTATFDRKDQRHKLTRLIMGGVLHKVVADTMAPRVYIHDTGIKIKDLRTWAYAMRNVYENEERNDLIFAYLKRDLLQGRSVLFPCIVKVQIHYWMKRLNQYIAREVNRGNIPLGEGYNYSKLPAVRSLFGETKRDERDVVKEAAIKGDVRVVVGMRRIIQTGINIPQWDCLYVMMPISNPPNFEQETGRIRTQIKGKPTPIIRHFVDQSRISRACFRTCWWKTYKNKSLKFSIPESSETKAKHLLKGL